MSFDSFMNEEEDTLRPLAFHPAFLLAPALSLPYTLLIKKKILIKELVKAFMVPKPGVALDTEELLAHCRQNLAKDKVHSDIGLRSEIKVLALGKPLRRALREEFSS